MTTEQPKNIFSVQILKGKVRLLTNETKTDVDEEELFVIHANIPYKIEALKKAIFLLTIVE